MMAPKLSANQNFGANGRGKNHKYNRKGACLSIFIQPIKITMETNQDMDKPMDKTVMDPIGKYDQDKAQDELHPKRTCFNQPSDDRTNSDWNLLEHNISTKQSLSNALPLPLPTQVGTVNIGQQGNINHNNGSGHQQMHVTHGGADMTRNLGMGLPQSFVQPHLNPMTDFNMRL